MNKIYLTRTILNDKVIIDVRELDSDKHLAREIHFQYFKNQKKARVIEGELISKYNVKVLRIDNRRTGKFIEVKI